MRRYKIKYKLEATVESQEDNFTQEETDALLRAISDPLYIDVDKEQEKYEIMGRLVEFVDYDAHSLQMRPNFGNKSVSIIGFKRDSEQPHTLDSIRSIEEINLVKSLADMDIRCRTFPKHREALLKIKGFVREVNINTKLFCYGEGVVFSFAPWNSELEEDFIYPVRLPIEVGEVSDFCYALLITEVRMTLGDSFFEAIRYSQISTSRPRVKNLCLVDKNPD